jgi:hypothetical protein
MNHTRHGTTEHHARAACRDACVIDAKSALREKRLAHVCAAPVRESIAAYPGAPTKHIMTDPHALRSLAGNARRTTRMRGRHTVHRPRLRYMRLRISP